MTDQPTFEYHDEDGDDLSVRPMRGIPAVLILTGTNGIAVDLDRVEEVIAGIRDAARTAAARQTTGQDDTDDIGLCGYCGVPRENHHHGYVSTADAIAAAPHRVTATAPAVGQPAEAHDTEARPELRERIAALFRSPAGAERLGDATPGEIADAVLSVLTVGDER